MHNFVVRMLGRLTSLRLWVQSSNQMVFYVLEQGPLFQTVPVCSVEKEYLWYQKDIRVKVNLSAEWCPV